MKTRYLAIFSTLVLSGLSVPAAADPCRIPDPEHKHCKPVPPPGPGGDFLIEVFFELTPATGTGPATQIANDPPTPVAGGGNDTRPMLGESPIELNVDLLDTAQLDDCSPMFGLPTGLFTVSTARIPSDSPEFTFVQADFFSFQGTDGVNYAVRFSPDGDGDISDDDNWLPAESGDTNTLTGDEISLAVKKGPGKKGPCNGTIAQSWRIEVEKD